MGDWLKKEEFQEFKDNDFLHLTRRVSRIERATSFIKGQLYVIVPLVIAILGLIIVLVVR